MINLNTSAEITVFECMRKTLLQKGRDKVGEGGDKYGFIGVSKVADYFNFALGKRVEQPSVNFYGLLAIQNESLNKSHTISMLVFGCLFLLDISDYDTREEFRGKEIDFEAFHSKTGIRTFALLPRSNIVLLTVFECGFTCTNYIFHPSICENGSSGFTLLGIETTCSEVYALGWVTRSIYHILLKSPLST